MAEIVWIGSPDYFKIQKDVLIVNCGQRLAGRLDVGCLLAVSRLIVLFVEGGKTGDDFLRGFLVTATSGLDQFDAGLLDKGETGWKSVLSRWLRQPRDRVA